MVDVDAKASEARSTVASHLEAPQQVNSFVDSLPYLLKCYVFYIL